MESNDFKGDLKKILPKKIIREEENDKVGAFFVVLGLIFNDLKDLVIFEQLMVSNYRKPKASECSDHAGNYGGIMIHINRLFAGIINEFFNFLKKNNNVLEEAEFKNVLERLPEEEKNMWNGMVAAASGELPKASEFINTLIRIRANFTYHYYQSGKVLRKGFISRFYNEEIDDRNKSAYYSIGESLNTTRFYFSDAAVEEALFLETGKTEKSNFVGDVSVEKYKLAMGSTIQIIQRIIMLLMKNFLQVRRNG
ncbi:MAG: hypothetical protein WC608_03770 [Parcubacteria group bacterium]